MWWVPHHVWHIWIWLEVADILSMDHVSVVVGLLLVLRDVGARHAAAIATG